MMADSGLVGAEIPLGPTKGEDAVALLSAGVGMIPGIGSVCQYILTEVIPNKRTDRIERYLQALDQKLEEHILRAAIADPVRLDTFEEGAWQSARGCSDERISHIATLVAEGIQPIDHKAARARHFLRLLPQLSDEQIIILTSYQSAYNRIGGEQNTAFRQRHADILGPFSRSIGDDIGNERASHKDALVTHLISLGLLKAKPPSSQIGGLARHVGELGDGLTAQGLELLRFLGLEVKRA